MNETQQMVLIMELADGSVRDELKKLENMFGLPYQILLQLIDHLGNFFALFNCFLIFQYFWFTIFCFILCDIRSFSNLFHAFIFTQILF